MVAASMTNRNSKIVNIISNKYRSQTLKRNHIPKSVTLRQQRLKSVRVVRPPIGDAALYTLRNSKVVQKKTVVMKSSEHSKDLSKSLSMKNDTLPRQSTNGDNKLRNKKIDSDGDNNIPGVTAHSRTERKRSPRKSNRNVSIDIASSPICYDTSKETTRCNFDAVTKLKILDMYYELQSLSRTSKLTGISIQTLSYWKKTHDSIRKVIDCCQGITPYLRSTQHYFVTSKRY